VRYGRILVLTAFCYAVVAHITTFTVEPWMIRPIVMVIGTSWDHEMHEIHMWHECIKGKAQVEWVRCAP